MRDNQTSPANVQDTGITFADAKKAVESMNLIDGFLFDSSTEDEEDAKVVTRAILKTALNREINEIHVTSQKQFQAIDTKYHGIRFDAYVEEDTYGNVKVTIYDIEMENRPADKKSLPRRLRFYRSLIDSRLLESGTKYDTLPNFVSITILSYDPFDAGDMYYEASTKLTTHPDSEYDDGVTHIFLYCSGKINESLSPEHGKRLMEVLKYIVSGEKINTSNPEVNDLEAVVSKIKKRSEVTRKYMKQWDRERTLVQEAKAEGRVEGRAEGRVEGRVEGRAEGSERALIKLITRKMAKGKGIQDIATDLDEEIDTIQKIYDAARHFAPDYDIDQIYNLLHQTQ